MSFPVTAYLTHRIPPPPCGNNPTSSLFALSVSLFPSPCCFFPVPFNFSVIRPVPPSVPKGRDAQLVAERDMRIRTDGKDHPDVSRLLSPGCLPCLPRSSAGPFIFRPYNTTQAHTAPHFPSREGRGKFFQEKEGLAAFLNQFFRIQVEKKVLTQSGDSLRLR